MKQTNIGGEEGELARKEDGRRADGANRHERRFGGLSHESEILARAAEAYEDARAAVIGAAKDEFVGLEARRRAAEEELIRRLVRLGRGFIWRSWSYGATRAGKDYELWRRPAPTTVGLGLTEGIQRGKAKGSFKNGRRPRKAEEVP